jgi:uncharacterized membrane protein YdjX (TVP38/TMEM64 family)
MTLVLVSGYLTVTSNFNFQGMIDSLKNTLLAVKSSSWVWFLPWLYIIIFTARPILLIPTFVMNLVAFAIFGPVQGFFWVLLAEQISALTLFLGLKHLSGESLKNNFEKMIKKSRLNVDQSGHKQFYLVAVLRLASLPFDFVTASCALSGIRLIPFLLATFLVSVPWLVLFFLVISSVTTGSITETILNSLIFIGFIAASGYLAKKSGLVLPKEPKKETDAE